MKIAIVDVFGLPYDGSTLLKRGLGGSESAIISISKELAKLGFDVKVFNDCHSDDAMPGFYDNVEYLPLGRIEDFSKGFDIFIASRSVAPFCNNTKGFKSFLPLPDFTKACLNSSLRVLWMHDTFCDGDDLIEELVGLNIIHEIFTLSDWHTSYITNCNHGRRRNFEVLKKHIWQTRNGINLWLDREVDIRDKDPNLFIYNSSASKGMIPLVTKIWPRIHSILPEVKLVIVGGYYKFKENQPPDNQEVLVNQLISEYNGKFNITFTGLISQKHIAKLCAKSSYMIYPGAYPETFGISSVEALAHNTPIICCTFGALEETAIDIACYKIPYAIEPNSLFPDINTDSQINIFIDKVIEAYRNKYLHQQKQYACNQIKDICTWETVALQWKQHFFSSFNKYLPVEEYRRVNKINSRVIEVFGRRFINKETMPVYKASIELPIKVIVPVYNADKYIKQCIESIKSQDYTNYKVILIDDNSTDNTLNIIYENINSDNFIVIKNSENMGAVYNQVTSINTYCSENDIIILIDGDDSLYPNPNIFNKINAIYIDKNAEFTYGSSWSLADNIPLIGQPYPEHIKQSKKYREYKFNWNMPYTHLRTFKKKLLDNISENCFKKDDKWMKAGADNALFYNLIEQANPDKIICIPDILYLYNDINPINDYKVNSEEQTLNASYILNNINKKISVIVPTMWKCTEIFKDALELYISSNIVDDIVIINNDHTNTPDWDILKNSKIRLVSLPQNIFVNPAWNLGVSLAKNEIINIVNDDIIYDVKCLEKIIKSTESSDFGIIGFSPGDITHNQPAHVSQNIDLIKCIDTQRPHGFGMCMFINKSQWIDIPDELKIYFGDDFLFDKFFNDNKSILLLTNIKFKTPFAQTTSTIPNHNEILQSEGSIYINKIKPTIIKEPKVLKSILIAIPTNKNICVETFKSIYDLEVPEGYVTHFQYFYGYQIDQIRNLIAEWGKHYDYLFSVDSDIVLPKDSLLKLLKADKDIVSGVYIQRKLEHNIPEIYLANNIGGVSNVSIDSLYAQNDSILEIDACGFGCVLVKNKVFLKMEYPHFYYKSALEHKDTISEDIYFCTKAKRLGFSIWVDTSIKCEHIGEYTFRVVEPPKK